jgi:hypothetical protein
VKEIYKPKMYRKTGQSRDSPVDRIVCANGKVLVMEWKSNPSRDSKCKEHEARKNIKR